MQIRVRAWHKTQKKMYYPEELATDQLTLMPDGRGFINVHGRDTRLSKIYDTIVPLLSTGLHDKKGKEIFEGDVITVPMDVRHKGVIKWHNKSACFYLDEPDIENFAWTGLIDYIEIIGNIYEHPELMEKVA